jgi:hypothetical protein
MLAEIGDELPQTRLFCQKRRGRGSQRESLGRDLWCFGEGQTRCGKYNLLFKMAPEDGLHCR